MDVNLVMPVGIEEGREKCFDLGSRQLLSRCPAQLEGLVGRAVVDVVIDLSKQHWREIDRDVHIVLANKSCHRVVVTNGVQADPRVTDTPFRSWRSRISIKRLVLVPE